MEYNAVRQERSEDALGAMKTTCRFEAGFDTGLNALVYECSYDFGC